MPSPRIVHVSRRLIGFVLVLTLKVDWVTYRLLLLENKGPEGLAKKIQNMDSMDQWYTMKKLQVQSFFVLTHIGYRFCYWFR